jgi:hypothetical protein
VTADDLHALIDRWRAGDEEGAVAFFTADGSFHEAGREPLIGRDALLGFWGPFFHGGPPWRMTVHDILGGEPRFAIVYTWEMGGKDGAWKASDGVAVVDVRDGKIARWREYKA